MPFIAEPELKPLNSSFNRVTLLEELVVTNYVPPTAGQPVHDTTPPGRITDVVVEDIISQTTSTGENREFTITWTAPGDDYNMGQGKLTMQCKQQCKKKVMNGK